MVRVIRSISCLSLVLCWRNGEWPLSSLYNMQPKLNQSALESYAVPFDNTSGAMYPCVPLTTSTTTTTIPSDIQLTNNNSIQSTCLTHKTIITRIKWIKLWITDLLKKKKKKKEKELHAGVWFLLGEVAGQSQIWNADVAVLVQQNIGRFQIAVNDVAPVHVLQTCNPFKSIKSIHSELNANQ